MKLYRLGRRWVSELEASESLKLFASTHGHWCNQVSDPNACCPVAHGATEESCTCAEVSRLRSVELLTIDGHAAITMDRSGLIYDRIADRLYDER